MRGSRGRVRAPEGLALQLLVPRARLPAVVDLAEHPLRIGEMSIDLIWAPELSRLLQEKDRLRVTAASMWAKARSSSEAGTNVSASTTFCSSAR